MTSKKLVKASSHCLESELVPQGKSEQTVKLPIKTSKHLQCYLIFHSATLSDMSNIRGFSAMVVWGIFYRDTEMDLCLNLTNDQRIKFVSGCTCY